MYTENYKTLMEETEEDTNEWEDITHAWIRRILLKCPSYPKWPLWKFQWSFHRNKTILKFVWNYKRPPNNQKNPEKKEKAKVIKRVYSFA